jgi:hypothetical protein
MNESATGQEVCRNRTNKELRELYKIPDPVVDLKRSSVWLGHVIRMDHTGVVNKIL